MSWIVARSRGFRRLGGVRLTDHGPGKGKPRKSRVSFRRNRQQPARRKQWALPPEDDPKADLATSNREQVRTKGDLSRKRTVIEDDDVRSAPSIEGAAVAVRGQYVEVDDGRRIWLCTIRRVLRTRHIRDRSPVVVGDRVRFAIMSGYGGGAREGVIEEVFPRRTILQRCDGRRTHVIAANVDQVVIVQSLFEPMVKIHLFDRYLVAAHAGGLEAVICINKIDLDPGDEAEQILAGYRRLGYRAVGACATNGAGIDELCRIMKDKATLIVGQSGVGKSSLLNAIQPGLKLPTAPVSESSEKGKHTTTTAVWLKLEMGGAVVDTPGIRALDVAMVPLNELEQHFVEFVDLVPLCKFPNCAHIHEVGCAIKAAVEAGGIDADRYDSYVGLFYELSEASKLQREQPDHR
ncbi:MAG TPA: ribosome small subunit-dependent GTPase A [Phycisphaerae bacterium]|nr:ribosome small subunit-dependent GTPase A [Phycisphaerae bacterium]